MDLSNLYRLDGKVAIVTGASYGLGVLFAEVLASAGADVVVTARSVDKLEDTKRIVEGLGRRCLAVACEWGDRNLRVNALAPNFFMSDMTRHLLEDSGMADWMRGRTPMRRMGELPELIGPILFLASDASSFVTGVVLSVDGGWSASGGYAQLPQPWDEWGGELSKPIMPASKP